MFSLTSRVPEADLMLQHDVNKIKKPWKTFEQPDLELSVCEVVEKREDLVSQTIS